MKSIFDQPVRDEIINRIKALNSSGKANWGKMSVEQMVRDCILCEKYYLGEVKAKRSLLGRLFGRKAINGILKNGLPKNASTRPQFVVTEEVNHLEEEKEKWATLIESYGSYSADHFKHWFFGNMTRDELGRFVYKHCNHHLSQFDC